MSSSIRVLLNKTLTFGAPYNAASRVASVQHGVTLIQSRSLVKDLYAYTTKKKRLDAANEKSLAWAKPLIEKREKELKQETEEGKGDEPHMLHVVYRVKTTRGRPWWEKQIVEKLKLDVKMNHPVIHKNTPYVNKLLNEIKHLIRIQPLTFPNGPPVSESDWEHTRINSRGEMIVVQRLQEYEPPTGTALPQPDLDKWTLDLETMKKDNADKIRNYTVHSEYFKSEYKFRRNQDGKEYRYNFNKNLQKYDW